MDTSPPSDPASFENRPINRVALACIQCRSRHVKCDSTQPICNRCRRDGKECIYQKSRRGGLDKAALERRRLKLQQQQKAQQCKDSPEQQSSNGSAHSDGADEHITIPTFGDLDLSDGYIQDPSAICFSVNTDRLVDLYYEQFYTAFPITLPLHYLNQRRKLNDNHGMDLLLLVIQFVGSVYAPWTPSDPYYKSAHKALQSPDIPRTGFTVQALLIFAVAQHHHDERHEARKILDLAIAMGVDMEINTKSFAYAHGEGNPVLEESWRRTYYLLHITDLHFAVVINSPVFSMMNVANNVDLPCDDEYYESGASAVLSPHSQHANYKTANPTGQNMARIPNARIR